MKNANLDRPASQSGLFLWVMHRFAEVFEDHAIMKGGMVLRLLDSPRLTNDIDYVFVPYESKKDIVEEIRSVLSEVDGAQVDIKLHSKMLRADFTVDAVSIQVEVNVALHCEAMPMATAGFARELGKPSQIVRVMSLPHALAHKLAAWNERRLWRDLYDTYFLKSQAGASPDLGVLDTRLAKIKSRLPKLKHKRSMTRTEFVEELRQAAQGLSDSALEQELVGLLPPDELAGLAVRIRVMVERLAQQIDPVA